MPEQPELAQLPKGLGWHMLGKQLILTCAHCGRRWRGDKYGDPRNQTYLREHLHDHEALTRKPAQAVLETQAGE